MLVPHCTRKRRHFPKRTLYRRDPPHAPVLQHPISEQIRRHVGSIGIGTGRNTRASETMGGGKSSIINFRTSGSGAGVVVVVKLVVVAIVVGVQVGGAGGQQ